MFSKEVMERFAELDLVVYDCIVKNRTQSTRWPSGNWRPRLKFLRQRFCAFARKAEQKGTVGLSPSQAHIHCGRRFRAYDKLEDGTVHDSCRIAYLRQHFPDHLPSHQKPRHGRHEGDAAGDGPPFFCGFFLPLQLKRLSRLFL